MRFSPYNSCWPMETAGGVIFTAHGNQQTLPALTLDFRDAPSLLCMGKGQASSLLCGKVLDHLLSEVS